MCGIFAYIGSHSFEPEPVLTALHHRGPDAQGSWKTQVGSQYLHLLHTRLAILDLSTAGEQPMVDPITGNVLIFNGEIYNFKELRCCLETEGIHFCSQTDTEVLLLGYRLWGETLIERLDGMFSLVLFDALAQHLLIARDHIGIKPLYYAPTQDGGMAFCSEVRGLMASGLIAPDWDQHSIYEYLTYGSVQEPATLRQAVKCFPPAHYGWLDLRADLPELSPLQAYWNLATIPCETYSSAATAQAEHLEVLNRTLNQQLVADVPIGLFLSAGIDSTVLACLLGNNHQTKLTAFTLGIENKTEDEGALAVATARRLNQNHSLMRLSPQQLHGWVSDSLQAMDQPSCDGTNTYLISRAAVNQGMKVVLSGCGADELHGGYPHFNGLNRLYRFGQNLHPTFLPLMMPLVRVLGLYKGRLYQERLQGLLGSIHSLPALVRETRRYFTPQQIQMIYPLAQDLSLCQSDSALEIHPNLEPKTIISLAELTGYLRNILLRDSDWATMANHQELRVPYLGKRYIETVFGIPWAFKQLNQKNKFLLSSQIPDDLTAITKRRKTGFNLDYSVYLTAFLRDIRYTALQHLNQAHGFQLDLDYIDQTLAMGDPNKQARRYWALTSLGFYLYQHG